MEGLPIAVVNGVGVVGAVVWLGWMLGTGRLATGRELREKNQRIEFLQTALEQRDRQVNMLMGESIPVTSTVLNALHRALEEGGET